MKINPQITQIAQILLTKWSQSAIRAIRGMPPGLRCCFDLLLFPNNEDRMRYFIKPLTEADARALCTWRYPDPYAIYNLAGSDEEEDLRYFLDPRNQFHSVLDEDGVLVGFCSFGEDAQVPGGDYTDTALDIGLGLRPDLTGRGLGAAVLDAILYFAQERFDAAQFRATVATFNLRSRRTFERHGFRVTQTFASGDDPALSFSVLVRGANSVANSNTR